MQKNQYAPLGAIIFVAVSAALYNAYSLDFFSIHFSPDRFAALMAGDVSSGRYVAAAFVWLCRLAGVDPEGNYPLFVAATAVAAGTFFWYLCSHYFAFTLSRGVFAGLCAAVMFAGPMLDLLSFREVVHHPLLIFTLAYAYLRAGEMSRAWAQNIIKLICVVLMFGVYQPAVIMVFVLAALKATFDLGDSTDRRRILTKFASEAALIFVATVLYLAAKAGLDHSLAIKGSRSLLNFRDADAVWERANVHANAIWQLYNPLSTLYGWSHVSLGLLVAMISLAWYVGRRNFAALGLLVIIICISQNPMNVVMSGYWPSLRSSFYIALVPPLVAAYLYQRTRKATAIYALAALYASASMLTLASMHRVRQQDTAFSRDIAAAIRQVKTDAAPVAIRMPADWSIINHHYYHDIVGVSFDMGTPALYATWTVGPYLRYATGLNLTYDGRSDCRPSHHAAQLEVTVVGGVANVCYH